MRGELWGLGLGRGIRRSDVCAPPERTQRNIVGRAESLIAEAVDLVIFIDEEPDLTAGRKVREVLVVTGYENGKYLVEYV